MYKSVILISVGAFALAAYVGRNPPEYLPDGKNAQSASALDSSGSAEAGLAADKTPVGNGLASTTLDRSGDGHFYANAKVNGASVRLMVDTGASLVVLTKADAQAIGLQFSEQEFTGSAESAGGAVKTKPVTLGRLAVGNLEAQNVNAVIIDSSLSKSLLGQSWLSRVGNVTIEGDQMVLR